MSAERGGLKNTREETDAVAGGKEMERGEGREKGKGEGFHIFREGRMGQDLPGTRLVLVFIDRRLAFGVRKLGSYRPTVEEMGSSTWTGIHQGSYFAIRNIHLRYPEQAQASYFCRIEVIKCHLQWTPASSALECNDLSLREGMGASTSGL